MTRDRETARRIAQEVQPLGGSVCTADDFAVDEEDDGEDFLS